MPIREERRETLPSTRRGVPGADRTRTCVACRTRRDAADVVRVVAIPSAVTEGEASLNERGPVGVERHMEWSVVLDVEERLQGRGAWLCANPACFRQVAKSGALARALEAPGLRFDATEVLRVARRHLARRVVDLVHLARKAGKLEATTRVVRAGMPYVADGQANLDVPPTNAPVRDLVIVAEDAGDGVARRIHEAAASWGIPVREWGLSEEWGEWLGFRGGLAAMRVRGPLAAKLDRALRLSMALQDIAPLRLGSGESAALRAIPKPGAGERE